MRFLGGRSTGSNNQATTAANEILTRMASIEPRQLSISLWQHITLENQRDPQAGTPQGRFTELMRSLTRVAADVPILEIQLPVSMTGDKRNSYREAVKLLDDNLQKTEKWKTISQKKVFAYDNNRSMNGHFLADFGSIKNKMGFCLNGDTVTFRVPEQVHLYGEPEVRDILFQVLENVGKKPTPTR